MEVTWGLIAEGERVVVVVCDVGCGWEWVDKKQPPRGLLLLRNILFGGARNVVRTQKIIISFLARK